MPSICDYHKHNPRFNTAFTFPFEMNHWFEDDDELLHGAQIRAAIQHRLNEFSDDDLEQACLCDPFDGMEESVSGSTWVLIEKGDGNNVRGTACRANPIEPWPQCTPTSLPDELKV